MTDSEAIQQIRSGDRRPRFRRRPRAGRRAALDPTPRQRSARGVFSDAAAGFRAASLGRHEHPRDRRSARRHGRWQEALDHFRAVLEDYPNSELADDATYGAAKTLYELDRYEEAVERANEFINRYPRSELLGDVRVVRFEAAEALVSQGNADYERYLRDAAAPQAPPQPPQSPRPGQAPVAPDAPDPRSDLRVMALDALISMDPEAAWPILQRIVSESDETELRGRAVWLLSQLDTMEAFDLLVDLARNDPDSEVRSKAIFWLGQRQDERALDVLMGLWGEVQDAEIRNQLLFALAVRQNDEPRREDVRHRARVVATR